MSKKQMSKKRMSKKRMGKKKKKKVTKMKRLKTTRKKSKRRSTRRKTLRGGADAAEAADEEVREVRDMNPLATGSDPLQVLFNGVQEHPQFEQLREELQGLPPREAYVALVMGSALIDALPQDVLDAFRGAGGNSRMIQENMPAFISMMGLAGIETENQLRFTTVIDESLGRRFQLGRSALDEDPAEDEVFFYIHINGTDPPLMSGDIIKRVVNWVEVVGERSHLGLIDILTAKLEEEGLLPMPGWPPEFREGVKPKEAGPSARAQWDKVIQRVKEARSRWSILRGPDIRLERNKVIRDMCDKFIQYYFNEKKQDDGKKELLSAVDVASRRSGPTPRLQKFHERLKDLMFTEAQMEEARASSERERKKLAESVPKSEEEVVEVEFAQQGALGIGIEEPSGQRGVTVGAIVPGSAAAQASGLRVGAAVVSITAEGVTRDVEGLPDDEVLRLLQSGARPMTIGFRPVAGGPELTTV